MSTPVDTDLYLVNRAGETFSVTQQTIMATLQDTDLLLVNRGDSSYKITGADFKASVETSTAPVIASALLTENDPTGDRFGGESFTTTMSMGPEGSPISDKYLKPYVLGAFSKYGQTSPITNIDPTGNTTLDPAATASYPYPNGGNCFTDTSSGAPQATGLTFFSTNTEVYVEGSVTFSPAWDMASEGVTQLQGGSYSAGDQATLNYHQSDGTIVSTTWTTPPSYSGYIDTNPPDDVVKITWSSTGDGGFCLSNFYIASNKNTVLYGGVIGWGVPTGFDLTLTNDQDLGYFEVGDVVQTEWNQAANWSAGGVGAPFTGYSWDGMFNGNLTNFFVPNTTGLWTSSELLPTNGSVRILGFLVDSTNWIKVNGVDINMPATSVLAWYDVPNPPPQLSTIEAKTTSGSQIAAIAAVECDGKILVNAGIPGAPGVAVTAISPSTPSISVDGGTWAVGDVVTNTVERQEQVILVTDDITESHSITAGTAFNTSAIWNNTTTYPGAPVGPAYGLENMFDGQVNITYGNPYIIWNVPGGQSFSGNVFMTAGIGDATYDAPVLYINGSSTPATQLTKTTANSYLAHYVFANSGPVTTLKIDSAGSGNTLVASMGIGNEWLLNTGIDPTGVDPVVCPALEGGTQITFLTDESLSAFTAGMAVKQNVPVTPVTSPIINITQNIGNVADLLGVYTGGSGDPITNPEYLFDGTNENGAVGTRADTDAGIKYTIPGEIPPNTTVTVNVESAGFKVNVGLDNGTSNTEFSNTAAGDNTFTTDAVRNTTYISVVCQNSNQGFPQWNSLSLNGSMILSGTTLTLTNDTQLDNFQPGDIVRVAWNQDKVWSDSLSGVSSALQGTPTGAFDGSELASAPVYLGAGEGNMLLTFNPPLSGEVTCLASSAGNADPTECKVVLSDGQETTIDAGYGASEWTTPLTTPGVSAITFVGSAVNGVALSAVKVGGQLLVNTGVPATSGVEVNSVTPASNQMNVDGGTWTNGDKVTGPLIDGTGSVTSTDPAANTMNTDSGRFAIGAKIQTVNPVPNPDAKMYCVTTPSGSILDITGTDPGYTQMSSNSATQVLTFPTQFPSGEPVDTELPAGTALAVDCKAQNAVGESLKTTNVVTPT